MKKKIHSEKHVWLIERLRAITKAPKRDMEYGRVELDGFIPSLMLKSLINRCEFRTWVGGELDLMLEVEGGFDTFGVAAFMYFPIRPNMIHASIGEFQAFRSVSHYA